MDGVGAVNLPVVDGVVVVTVGVVPEEAVSVAEGLEPGVIEALVDPFVETLEAGAVVAVVGAVLLTVKSEPVVTVTCAPSAVGP